MVLKTASNVSREIWSKSRKAWRLTVFWDFKKLIIVVMDREFLHAAGARVKAPIVLSETCREAPLLDIKKL